MGNYEKKLYLCTRFRNQTRNNKGGRKCRKRQLARRSIGAHKGRKCLVGAFRCPLPTGAPLRLRYYTRIGEKASAAGAAKRPYERLASLAANESEPKKNLSLRNLRQNN